MLQRYAVTLYYLTPSGREGEFYCKAVCDSSGEAVGDAEAGLASDHRRRVARITHRTVEILD